MHRIRWPPTLHIPSTTVCVKSFSHIAAVIHASSAHLCCLPENASAPDQLWDHINHISTKPPLLAEVASPDETKDLVDGGI